jgi:hypothetical protein
MSACTRVFVHQTTISDHLSPSLLCSAGAQRHVPSGQLFPRITVMHWGHPNRHRHDDRRHFIHRTRRSRALLYVQRPIHGYVVPLPWVKSHVIITSFFFAAPARFSLVRMQHMPPSSSSFATALLFFARNVYIHLQTHQHAGNYVFDTCGSSFDTYVLLSLCSSGATCWP